MRHPVRLHTYCGWATPHKEGRRRDEDTALLVAAALCAVMGTQREAGEHTSLAHPTGCPEST
eukprot:5400804-Pyramimonas_sp.AAC.1